jgi:predicted dehydrogenase
LGNWGVHYFDAIRWLTGDEAPAAVVAVGGIYAVKDDRTIPDTLQAVFELPSGCLLLFGQYEASSSPALKWGEMELRGTQGALYVSTKGYRIFAERGGQFQDPGPRGKDEEFEGEVGFDNMTELHIRNFLDCIRSREKPNADAEVGHRSCVFSHLANIALATKSRIEWDPETERITNNEAANDLLHYEYRKGYTLG